MAVDAPSRPEPPTTEPDRRPLYLGLVILVAILVAAGAIAAVTLAQRQRPGFVPGPAPRPAGDGHSVSAPLAGRRDARLDLAGGVGSVTVRTTDLGDEMYRISTPAGSGPVPQVADQDGSVRVQLGGGGGPAVVEVLLSSRANWRFRLGGGADEARLDLRGGPVSGVDIASGVSRVELWLPRPKGTVTVRESGGASEFTVHAPAGVPVRVEMSGGGGQADLDGVTHSGIPGNTVYPAPGWDQAADRYDLDAVAGVSRLLLDRY